MGRKNDKNIKEVMGLFLIKNPKIANGISHKSIQDIWKSEMGDVINGYTDRITFKDGTLKVFLNSAPLKREMLNSKEKIIQLINAAAQTNLVLVLEVY